MRKKAFEIALSGVAAAIAAIFLALGTLNSYLLMTGYLFGTFAIMLPLARQFPWGAVMAYIAASLLALLLGGIAFFWRLLPFLCFFGLHPICNFFQVKHGWNRWLLLLLKAAWFDATLYLLWRFVFGMTTNFPLLDQWIGWVIGIGGSLVFFGYDYLIFQCQVSINRVVAKIKRR